MLQIVESMISFVVVAWCCLLIQDQTGGLPFGSRIIWGREELMKDSETGRSAVFVQKTTFWVLFTYKVATIS